VWCESVLISLFSLSLIHTNKCASLSASYIRRYVKVRVFIKGESGRELKVSVLFEGNVGWLEAFQFHKGSSVLIV
jgi:hypothetical protein